MAVIAGRNVANHDLGIMVAGVLMFIDSFLPWYGASFLGATNNVSAWSAGFGAWFPVLLVMVISASVGGNVFAGRSMPRIGSGAVSWELVNVAAAAIAVIIILLRWVTYPDAPAHSGISAGAKFGTYVGLIIAAVQTFFCYVRATTGGQRMPWQQRRV